MHNWSAGRFRPEPPSQSPSRLRWQLFRPGRRFSDPDPGAAEGKCPHRQVIDLCLRWCSRSGLLMEFRKEPHIASFAPREPFDKQHRRCHAPDPGNLPQSTGSRGGQTASVWPEVQGRLRTGRPLRSPSSAQSDIHCSRPVIPECPDAAGATWTKCGRQRYPGRDRAISVERTESH